MKHHKGRIIRKVIGCGGGGWENTKQNSCKQAKMSGKKILQAETEEKCLSECPKIAFLRFKKLFFYGGAWPRTPMVCCVNISN